MNIKEDRQKFYNSFIISHELFENVVGNVVSFDLKLNRTGIAITNLNKPNNFTTQSILFKPSKQLERYKKVNLIIKQAIKLMNDYNPKLIVIENYSFAPKRSSSITTLAELGGILRWNLGKFKIPILEVAPLQLKKWILGQVHGEKNLILKNVYKRYKYDAPNDDEADALVLADIGSHLVRLTSKDSLESSSNEYLKEYMKSIPVLFQEEKPRIHQYHTEVVYKLIQEQGNRLKQYWTKRLDGI